MFHHEKRAKVSLFFEPAKFFSHFFVFVTVLLEKFIISHIIRSLPFVPNDGQRHLAAQLAHFLLSPAPRKTFVLKGYAGTGKTSMVAALVHAMQQMRQLRKMR